MTRSPHFVIEFCALTLLAGASFAHAAAAPAALRIGNGRIAWRGRVINGTLRQVSITNQETHKTLAVPPPCFAIVLNHHVALTSADFTLSGQPEYVPLPAHPRVLKLARHFPGREIIARFVSPKHHLRAAWRVRVRRGADYLRETLTLRATGGAVAVDKVILFKGRVPGDKTIGAVEGSPLVAGNFFLGYENPMAKNFVGAKSTAVCQFTPFARLKKGRAIRGGCVIGVAPAGQMRRAFLAYIERERPRPYQPFLHYNSWYDIGGGAQYNQAQCLHAINAVGTELVRNRGVKLDSFLFDDGWDNYHRLWAFNRGFPHGFTPLWKAARRYNAGVGIWLSPWGGYGGARVQRLKYGKLHGYEINASGFDLAGPKYYHRFRDICLRLVKKYHINSFKFDGLAAGGRRAIREGRAMLRLDRDLRAAKRGLYISQTTGTWASPFWLLYADSIWRGGADHAYQGAGSWCQRWITYRDAQTYQNVVKQGPLYPLNSLMLHGIILARFTAHLHAMSNRDFADQAWSFFGTGTQLQELYLTPHLLNNIKWNTLARAAKWSRANASVLADTHWIGGDPAKGQIYGWAAWAPGHAIIVLRNPAATPATYTADIGTLLQLPKGSKISSTFRTPRKHSLGNRVTRLRPGHPRRFVLKAFQLLVLESGAKGK